jgi:hypothetical protein
MLMEKIDKILEFIKSKQSFTEFNQVIFNILEGDLITYVEQALRKQLISDNAYKSAKEGISPINIIKKVTDKLTKLYASPVKRTVLLNNEPSPRNQEIIDWYVENLKVNKYMRDFNYFMNSTKMSLIEPFISKDNSPKFRVIPSHQFLVWSDDPIEPNIPTVLIKFMGEREFNGKNLNVYFLYSDEEFIAINSDGDIVPEYMQDNDGINVYGVIPATYGNVSDFQLIPTPDTDLLQIGKLIPLMFTHSNDAIKYMSYSIVYGIDVDSENLERNPSVFWVFKSDGDKKPQVGQIKPEVDTTKVIENIMVQLDAWLETKSIKVSSAGKARADNSLSGVSLMIKEMDTIQALKDQMSKMEDAENQFWRMMANVHNYWVASGIVKKLPLMDKEISVKVEYELPKPVESEDERLDRAIKVKTNQLATTKDAISIWKPKLSEEELQEKIKELDKEFSTISIEKEDSGGEDA